MNPFREALEGWTEDTWGKGIGTAYPSHPTPCVVGRLTRSPAYRRDVVCDFALVARELFPDRRSAYYTPNSPEGWISQFNDHEDTTFEDVVQVLEKAAVRWDEQQ